uniref:Uncharacterized protein n=1 Tax=Meloidogyne hapla TaxID=6305 RepID=A0A1I8B449_MELHA
MKTGCGTCDENKINVSCVDCNDFKCNSKIKLEETIFCYEREENGKEVEGIRPCADKMCYVSVDMFKAGSEAVALQNFTLQGCGECPSKDIPCQTCNKTLCNTQKLFNESLYCWLDETIEPKTFTKCDEECFTRRNSDGKLEQGCGNCKDNDCRNCKQKFCNTKDIGAKHCLTNNGSTCSAELNETCFAERTETNECGSEEAALKSFTRQGCGKCPSTSIPCQTCNTTLCNTETFFKECHYCWANESTTVSCKTSEYGKIEQGCGNKTSWTEYNVRAAKCQNEHLCNTKKLFEDSLFCLNKGKDQMVVSKKSLKQCDEECFILRHSDGKWCGNCTSPTCDTCTDHRCNEGNNFPYYCFGSDGKSQLECPNPDCYIDKVEQGCGNKTSWTEYNVRAAKCQNKHLCNTQNLFNDSLFCLNKGKDELNETKSSVIQCDNECVTRRHSDGKLEQGCGNCTDTDCKSCKHNFCNNKTIGVKHCWNNNGSTCSTGYYENCFTMRTETNEWCGNCTSPTCDTCTDHRCNDGVNFTYYCLKSDGKSLLECPTADCYIDKEFNTGCGICDDNKINKSCVDCNDFKCNSRKKLEEQIFCYEREENGKETEGGRPCVEKTCFISVDILKVDQGCGEVPQKFNDTPYATCNKPLCNTKELFNNTLFCLTKGKEELEVKKAIKQCDKKCFVHRHSDGKLEQGCDKCPENVTSTDCNTCEEKYCNVEKNVNIHCWVNDKEICKTSFNDYCFTERMEDNGCCGKKGCVSSTCNKCYSHRCNNVTEYDYFCRRRIGYDNKCKNSTCYITNLEETDKGGADWNCGECPDIQNHQYKCAQCNNSPFCNTVDFYNNAMFCWNKTAEMTEAIGDLRNCKTQCFVARDLNGTVNKGCAKCNSSTTCKQCQDNRCNNETEFPYFCKGVDGDKECNHSDCYILKDANESSFLYNCGKCPESNLLDSSLDDKLSKEVLNINIIQCAECKNSPFCNTAKFFEEQLFCWVNSTSKMGIEKGSRVCESKCFVSRNSTSGQSKKGCSDCGTKACRKCQTHRCNDWEDIPYFCYSNGGIDGVTGCTEADCYILKWKNKDNKNEFYQNCGKCPFEANSSLISTTDELLRKRLTENQIDEIQCAECYDGTLCNTEKFIEEKLYCLERSPNDETFTKGAGVCEEQCFVARNYTTGFVKKGCGKCPFFTCKECNTHRCNNETVLPFYCFGNMAHYKECNESVCYIAKVEEKNGGVYFN